MSVTFVLFGSRLGAGVPATPLDTPAELDDGDDPAAPANAPADPADVAVLPALVRDDEQLDIAMAAATAATPIITR